MLCCARPAGQTKRDKPPGASEHARPAAFEVAAAAAAARCHRRHRSFASPRAGPTLRARHPWFLPDQRSVTSPADDDVVASGWETAAAAAAEDVAQSGEVSRSRISALSTSSRHPLEALSSIGPPGTAFRHTSDLRVGVIEVRVGARAGCSRARHASLRHHSVCCCPCTVGSGNGQYS